MITCMCRPLNLNIHTVSQLLFRQTSFAYNNLLTDGMLVSRGNAQRRRVDKMYVVFSSKNAKIGIENRKMRTQEQAHMKGNMEK